VGLLLDGEGGLTLMFLYDPWPMDDLGEIIYHFKRENLFIRMFSQLFRQVVDEKISLIL